MKLEFSICTARLLTMSGWLMMLSSLLPAQELSLDLTKIIEFKNDSGFSEWTGKLQIRPNRLSAVAEGYAGNAGTLELVDLKKGKREGPVLVLPKEARWHVSGDGSYVWFTYSNDGDSYHNRIARFDLNTGKRTEICQFDQRIGGYGTAVLEASPGRVLLVTHRHGVGFDGIPLEVFEADLMTGKTTRLLHLPHEPGDFDINYSYEVHDLAWAHKAGQLWFTMALPGKGEWFVGGLDVVTGRFQKYSIANSFHHSLAIQPGGGMAVILIGDENKLFLLDSKSGQVKKVDMAGVFLGGGYVTISPDGKYAVGCSLGSKFLTCVKLPDGDVSTIRVDGSNRVVTFSPDGQWLAVTNSACNILKVYELATGKQVAASKHLETTGTTRLVEGAGLPFLAGPPALYSVDESRSQVLMCYGSPIYHFTLKWPSIR